MVMVMVIVMVMVMMQIDSYSAFFDNGHITRTELDELLKARNIAKLYVVGLATDYCVYFTAMDARTLGLIIIYIYIIKGVMFVCLFVCLYVSMFRMAGQTSGPIETKLDTRTHVHPGSVSGKVNVGHSCMRAGLTEVRNTRHAVRKRHLANDAQTTSGGRRRRHLPNDYETSSG